MPISTKSSSGLKQIEIAEMSTAQIGRYRRGITISPDNQDTNIPAMTTKRVKKLATDGWDVFEHPEGALYYYHTEKRVYTDMNILDHGVAQELAGFADELYGALNKKEDCPPKDDVELVLEIASVKDGRYCGYYFANKRDACLFWLRDYTPNYILQECRGVSSLPHKMRELEAQYWKHVEFFPHARKISESIVQELECILTFAAGDTMTSHVSTSNALYSPDLLQEALSLVNGIKITNGYVESAYLVCFIGRMMNKFRHNQFLQFHGEQCARLSRDQSVYGESYTKRSLMMIVLSSILFRAPYVHIRALHNLYVDTLVNEDDWKRFVGRLISETQDFNLLATVFLGANVGFLAINTVDEGNGRSISQVASYMSMIASFGSMLLGVRLVRKNFGDDDPDGVAECAQRILSKAYDSSYGLETLSIVYSLPYALLVWGVIFFVLAFSAECFKHSDVVTRVPVIFAASVVLAFVGYSMHTTGERGWKISDEGDESGTYNLSSAHRFTKRIRTLQPALSRV
ncbi:hypothetical protein BJ138DRAFT_1073194 [Hygrophoropsis aurantiaca]|uniref:Uncharacterized protein n=1 Tax=Hygrophoropsis aurantiaca TaxID=72124 RepID=A0ACB7ZVY1_9AGAM|nr:hypothetical protein BJ138DRAFT_1073194 [Hygrophoropsis aurantiaca]